MINDVHVHMGGSHCTKEDFIAQLDTAGVEKALLMSHQPKIFGADFSHGDAPEDRLGMLIEWAAAYPDKIIPFHWIDPLEDDVFEQIDRALAAHIKGFKVIFNRSYPGDETSLRVCEHIAKAGKPMLFHSGILYSDRPSSEYNRPIAFEPLLDIPNLRFAMAHISWPWCDECIAVYGKWAYTRSRISSELFLDATPGTPRMYRKDVLSKLFDFDFPVEDNLLFGSDCFHYEPEKTSQYVTMDKAIFDEIGVTRDQQEKYFHKNFFRFIGE